MKLKDETISILLTVVAISFLISFWSLLTVDELVAENRKLEDTVYNTLNKLEDYKWYTNGRIWRLQNTSDTHWNNITSNYREMMFIERKLGIDTEANDYVNKFINKWQREDEEVSDKEFSQWLQTLKEKYNQ